MSRTPTHSVKALLPGSEDRFYLVVLALFVCLMGSIWLWVTGDVRQTREDMWRGVLETTARDVSADIDNGMRIALRRLEGVAARLEAEGGIRNPTALSHAFDNGFVGLMNSMHLYTTDGEEVFAGGTRKKSQAFRQIAEHYAEEGREQNDADGSGHICIRDSEAGTVLLWAPVISNGATVAYLQATFNMDQQIRNWEDKIGFREGLLCLVNRQSEVFYYAGNEAEQTFGSSSATGGSPSRNVSLRASKAGNTLPPLPASLPLMPSRIRCPAPPGRCL